jgi:hypothetical protein
MDELGRNYLTLALNLDRHFEGFVDAYFGPPELKAQVEATQPRSLEALADDARKLQEAIEDSDYDPQRKDFLTRQMRAMAAVIRNLAGDQLYFVEEVELYFDITPNMVDEAIFEEIHAELQRLLPGKGSLSERMAAWQKSLELEPDGIMPVLELALRQTRRRTRALFDLPPGEEASLNLVENQPWTAYNWYLGHYRSRIDVDTEVPMWAVRALRMVAHEAYPGHHTEHAIKEYRLYRQEGRAEHAVQLLVAPESVLSEGIADNGLMMIFSDAELAAFLCDALYPLAGRTGAGVEAQIGITQKKMEMVLAVDGNAALLLHRDGRPAEEVRRYVDRYALRTPGETARAMEFLQNPLFRSYVFTYAKGKALLAPLLEGPDAAANFRRLLSEAFTPTQIRRWLAERGASPLS